MMKIIHIITTLSTGGAEQALYRLLSGGLEKRFDNLVISLADEGVFGPLIRGMGIPVYALGMRRGLPSIRGVYKLRKVVTKFQPDVIQGWMYHGNLAAWLARHLASGLPGLAWNVRNGFYRLENEKPISRLVIRANRFLSGSPAAILYNSRLSRRQHETFGFRASCGRVIFNGFNVEQLAPSEHKARTVRAELGIPDNTRVVGHVARLHPMKDHHTFLRAAVAVAGLLRDVHIVLCGREVVWENRALTALIPGELRGRFHFLGERKDVPELMCAMDVFCQSSWSEAFPNVLGEAMSTGLPCVATDVGDTADIVDNTGLVIPPKNETAMIAALKTMLEWPAARRESLGRAARARVNEKYSFQMMLEQYTSFYNGLGYGA